MICCWQPVEDLLSSHRDTIGQGAADVDWQWNDVWGPLSSNQFSEAFEQFKLRHEPDQPVARRLTARINELDGLESFDCEDAADGFLLRPTGDMPSDGRKRRLQVLICAIVDDSDRQDHHTGRRGKLGKRGKHR